MRAFTINQLKPLIAGFALLSLTENSLRGQQLINYTDGQTNSDFILTTAPYDPTTLHVATGAATQTGWILGTGSIIKSGEGTLTVPFNASYTGGTYLEGGRLQARGSDSLGDGDIYLSDGTELRWLEGALIDNDIHIAAGESARISVGTDWGVNLTGDYSGNDGNLHIGAADAQGIVEMDLRGDFHGLASISVDYGTLRNGYSFLTNSRDTFLNIGAQGTVDLNGNDLGGVVLSGSGRVTNSGTQQRYFISNRGTFSGVIEDGTGGTTLAVSHRLDSPGPLILSGENTYTGETYVFSSSTLTLAHDSAAGTGQINLTGQYSTLDYADGVTIDNTIVVEFLSYLSVTSGAATQVGQIVGEESDSRFAKIGDGELILTNANILTDRIGLFGGTLTFTDAFSLGPPETNSTFVFDGGTLKYSSLTQGTYYSGRRLIMDPKGGAIDVDTQPEYAIIADRGITGTGDLTKKGAGSLVINGGHSGFTGDVNVEEGGFYLGHSDTNWSGNAFSVAVGAHLSLNTGGSGTFISLASLEGEGEVIFETSNVNGNDVITLTVGANNADTTYSGNMGTQGLGVGALVKVGSGTFIVGGDNAFSGGTTIDGGTLSIAHSNALGTGAVRVNSGTLHVQEGAAPSNEVVLSGGTYSRDLAGDLAYVLDASSDLAGGRATAAAILAGHSSESRTLTSSFSTTSSADNDGLRLSDVYSLSGSGDTIFALQLTLAGQEEEAAFLAWYDGSGWVNAIEGNAGNNALGSMQGFAGSFANFQSLHSLLELEDYLGAYGWDAASGSAWAVLKHNSDFAIAVPEPGPVALGLISGSLLWSRRSRRC